MMAKATVCSIAFASESFPTGSCTSESRDVRQYTGVRAGAAFKVSITINGQEGVTVQPRRRGDPGAGGNRRLDENSCVSIDTEALARSQSPPLSVREDSIRLVSQGSSSIQLAVESSLVIANLQGSSILDVSGSATAGQITAQGFSQFNGLDLRLTTAQVTGQGSSQIAIAVSTSVTGSLHGSAQVQLRGQPQVQIQRSDIRKCDVSPIAELPAVDLVLSSFTLEVATQTVGDFSNALRRNTDRHVQSGGVIILIVSVEETYWQVNNNTFYVLYINEGHVEAALKATEFLDFDMRELDMRSHQPCLLNNAVVSTPVPSSVVCR
ncbi:hypothetical protein BV898_17737 [Hypsibius exemplaris]|uniref:Putative auto-transporter adhesin head GIN domain-containing protein n=1 Tax=Hypsibius exemplaris TaxID=2072580 RepID=A0A9X6RMT0_HYPEX|nr:hypothetical protein BV898_17737 [Hypsibius exemplaris]